MNNIDTTIDPLFNPSPHYTNWQLYDSPTVFRRQDRGFLERTWKTDQLNLLNQEQYTLSRLELETLVTSYGGVCRHLPDLMLLVFDDTGPGGVKLNLSNSDCQHSVGVATFSCQSHGNESHQCLTAI